MVAPLKALVAIGTFIFVRYSVGDGLSCTSPQYIELAKRGTISCSLRGVYAISWYNSTILRNEYPIIHYKNLRKRGSGYASGEFDIYRNGSLIITNVSLQHDHYFAVEYLQSESSVSVVINVDVIVIVYPIPNYPVIKGCNDDKYCVLGVENEGNLTCSVYGIRPKVQLHWMTFKEQEMISFKPQQTSIAERRDTFDISLTSAYQYNFRAADRITVACKVINPDVVLFDMATTIDLIFFKALQQLTTVEVGDRNNLPQNKTAGSVAVGLIAVVIIAAAAAALIYKVIRQKKQQSTSEINKEKGCEMLPSQSPQNDDYKDLHMQLKIYLQDKNDHLCEALDKSKNNSHKELQEILRIVCFMGVDISGDENSQKSAINLLSIATNKEICIKSVLFRECFHSVDLKASVIITNSNQRLTSKTNFIQLNIDFGNESLRTEDLPKIKKLFIFASNCPKLRTLMFTNCVLPLQFEDISVLNDLQNNNVEVYWENGTLIPKYVLNLSNGQWENDADGSRLKENDYIYLGSRNYSPRQMVLAEKIFRTMERFFKLHGAETIDTPLFDLKKTFVQTFEPKYYRLMYNLNDQGNESVSLRFDLTIPFVRYIEINNVTSMKRYHMAKVYRRGSSVMKGRRCGEFYQCDFDIAGVYHKMVPDAECIEIICTILNELNVGEFIVKVNHQKVLQGLSKLLNIPKEDIFEISDLIDREPYISIADISRIFNNKQLSYGDAEIAKLREYLKIKGGQDQIETLLQDEKLVSKEEAKDGLQDLKLLFQFCAELGIAEKVQFEMDLTRSLGYYTGVFFEAVSKVPRERMDKNFKTKGILANGGRFDNLVEKFTRGRRTVPCVGFTLDFEQLFILLEIKETNKDTPTKETEVLVTFNNPQMAGEILKVCKQLWDAGVKAEIAHTKYEITDVDKKNIAFIVRFPDKDTERTVIVTSSEEKNSVKKSEVVSFIKKRKRSSKEQNLVNEDAENQGRNETRL